MHIFSILWAKCKHTLSIYSFHCFVSHLRVFCFIFFPFVLVLLNISQPTTIITNIFQCARFARTLQPDQPRLCSNEQCQMLCPEKYDNSFSHDRIDQIKPIFFRSFACLVRSSPFWLCVAPYFVYLLFPNDK